MTSQAVRLHRAHPAHVESLCFEAQYLMEKLVKDRVTTDRHEAEMLFREVKRYLFLTRADDSRIFEMHSLRVDEVWHQFVLYTKEYSDFCNRYFGVYLPHRPSNAPSHPETDGLSLEMRTATFDEFRIFYRELFDEDLPDCWYDERNVTLARRVIDSRVGTMLITQDADKVKLIDGSGSVAFAINSLAAAAIEFIAETGAFYVRELPGGLEDDEKVALIATLVEHKLVRLGS